MLVEAGCEIRSARIAEQTAQLVRQTVEEGFDRLIVAGGDGTLSQVTNALAPDFAGAELAVLPLGTGNDLARALGIPLDDLESAGRIALGGRARPIDVVRVHAASNEATYFLNVASGGFGGKVASDIQPGDKNRWGPFAYWLTAATELAALETYRVRAELDEITLELDLYGLGIANGRYVGGGFPIAPLAILDDGLLDVTTIPAIPTSELLLAGLNFTLGGKLSDGLVGSYRTKILTVHATPQMPFSVDGEPLRAIHGRFEVVSRALMIVPGQRPEALSR